MKTRLNQQPMKKKTEQNRGKLRVSHLTAVSYETTAVSLIKPLLIAVPLIKPSFIAVLFNALLENRDTADSHRGTMPSGSSGFHELR